MWSPSSRRYIDVFVQHRFVADLQPGCRGMHPTVAFKLCGGRLFDWRGVCFRLDHRDRSPTVSAAQLSTTEGWPSAKLRARRDAVEYIARPPPRLGPQPEGTCLPTDYPAMHCPRVQSAAVRERQPLSLFAVRPRGSSHRQCALNALRPSLTSHHGFLHHPASSVPRPASRLGYSVGPAMPAHRPQ